MEKALAPFINMTDKEDKLDRTEDIKVIFDKCLESSIQTLLDCEADCIKSGNSLSPKEQKIALDVIANIQQRMYGNEVKCLNCGGVFQKCKCLPTGITDGVYPDE